MSDTDWVKPQKISVMVLGERYSFDTRNLRVNRHDLDTEVARQAELYAAFSVLYEKARAERAVVEAELKDLEAELDSEIRRTVTPKPTEDAIKKLIRSSARRRDLQSDLLEREAVEGQLSAFVYAMAQRKDLVVTLARARDNELRMPSAIENQRTKQLLKSR